MCAGDNNPQRANDMSFFNRGGCGHDQRGAGGDDTALR
jgi:hypothetical protein